MIPSSFVFLLTSLSSVDGFHVFFSDRKLTSINLRAQCQENESTISKLISRFQGDFDNYDQVVSDRKQGLVPKEGGGHEHFHVTLIPLKVDLIPNNFFPVGKAIEDCGAVMASYYFDGMPDRIFRLRVYVFNKSENNEVHMKLYSLDKNLEMKLRENCVSAVEEWNKILEDYIIESRNGTEELFKEMKECDILWSNEPDETRHSYLLNFENSKEPTANALHAVMINDHDIGGVLLESQMMPGSYIRVQDELSLWDNDLWINDRGHDPESKEMVYGNVKGVPYQMTRVSRLVGGPSKFERHIIDKRLAWTLGSQWRKDGEYFSLMEAIGGSSAQMNKSHKSSK